MTWKRPLNWRSLLGLEAAKYLEAAGRLEAGTGAEGIHLRPDTLGLRPRSRRRRSGCRSAARCTSGFVPLGRRLLGSWANHSRCPSSYRRSAGRPPPPIGVTSGAAAVALAGVLTARHLPGADHRLGMEIGCRRRSRRRRLNRRSGRYSPRAGCGSGTAGRGGPPAGRPSVLVVGRPEGGLTGAGELDRGGVRGGRR